VQHRSRQRIGHSMPGHVDEGDTRCLLAAGEILHHIESTRGDRLHDARPEIVSLLEINLDDVIAADGSVEHERAAVDIDTVELWDVLRLRPEVLRDFLEVAQLALQTLEQFERALALMGAKSLKTRTPA
jgi:hypothetical protein